MKTLVFSTHDFEKSYLEKAASEKLMLEFTNQSLNLNNLSQVNGYQALALFSSDNANAQVLEAIAKMGVQYLSLRSVGYEHVHLPTAKKLGIKVANVPAYSPYAIAEHGIAMLLMLNRKLYQAQLLQQMQDFRLDALIGFDLHGKTIGIIGTGKIGMATASIFNGFGCKLLGYDPVMNPQANAVNLKYVSFHELLERADVVSLNCPLNEHTHHLINDSALKRMKKGAILINTARGGVVDTNSLIKYLLSNHLGGACLDVYDNEKGLYFQDYRNKTISDPNFLILRSMPKVLITGHQAFLTNEALKGIAQTTIENLLAWKNNQDSINEL